MGAFKRVTQELSSELRFCYEPLQFCRLTSGGSGLETEGLGVTGVEGDRHRLEKLRHEQAAAPAPVDLLVVPACYGIVRLPVMK